jgi:hypothetical protein
MLLKLLYCWDLFFMGELIKFSAHLLLFYSKKFITNQSVNKLISFSKELLVKLY